MKAEIKGLFPTPLYKSILDRELTSKELKFLDSLTLLNNEFNLSSDNSDILSAAPLKKLKQELQKRVDDYFNQIVSPADPITPYITESWFNITKPNHKHHNHKHPNSIVSGVFYLNEATIFFHKHFNATIEIDKKQFNHFNTDTFFENVDTNQIILFPSELEHSVKTHTGLEDRKSIAFNVFIKGTLGTNSRLKRLSL